MLMLMHTITNWFTQAVTHYTHIMQHVEVEETTNEESHSLTKVSQKTRCTEACVFHAGNTQQDSQALVKSSLSKPSPEIFQINNPSTKAPQIQRLAVINLFS